MHLLRSDLQKKTIIAHHHHAKRTTITSSPPRTTITITTITITITISSHTPCLSAVLCWPQILVARKMAGMAIVSCEGLHVC